MYIASVPNRNSPPAILLRASYRDGKKIKTQTLANLTHWSTARVEALRRCLRGDFDGLPTEEGEGPVSDRIFGVLFALKAMAQRQGIVSALGTTRLAKLALFLVLARVAHQGSRLSAVRWANEQAVEEVLGLTSFNEDDLYGALDDLASRQEEIEKKLFRTYVKKTGQPPVLVLYDVTSSYFEGQKNELAAYGYSRDGKKGCDPCEGKKQIVIGLLTAPDGEPLAVRVFEGNTADPTTVAEQIQIVKTQFGIEEVVFVGDRGRVKSTGKTALTAEGFRYITALTDAQVRTLLKRGIIQMGLFDEVVQEVVNGDRRFILRRNEAVRHKEVNRRQDKLAQLDRHVAGRNAKVEGAKGANPEASLRKITTWAKTHKLNGFVTLSIEGRVIHIEMDDEKRADVALLDGCYVVETDVLKTQMDAQTVEARYKDLQKVERDFRTMKTSLLETRPIFVRKESRTRGHVFAAMLALKVVREMEGCLKQGFGTTEESDQALTLNDALTALSRLCFQRHEVGGEAFLQLPRPDKKQEAIFKALGIPPPDIRLRRLARM